ncbi:PREDICTED: uncharacterized protein LOC108519698 isoform X2 [Rhinopithecus bieti]|uniref:uncharacterized protein LOC108519698 isoform X2 n=1 Tax=Rhinopithecus bieti TaxID=61621 RepID=UPI00083BEFDE|nr:PREDICTED: uncharacterized protein LOC108519698 isoform X2 [Rhinopithecus bieti]
MIMIASARQKRSRELRACGSIIHHPGAAYGDEGRWELTQGRCHAYRALWGPPLWPAGQGLTVLQMVPGLPLPTLLGGANLSPGRQRADENRISWLAKPTLPHPASSSRPPHRLAPLQRPLQPPSHWVRSQVPKLLVSFCSLPHTFPLLATCRPDQGRRICIFTYANNNICIQRSAGVSPREPVSCLPCVLTRYLSERVRAGAAREGLGPRPS